MRSTFSSRGSKVKLISLKTRGEHNILGGAKTASVNQESAKYFTE